MKVKPESPQRIFILEQRIANLQQQLKDAKKDSARYQTGMSKMREEMESAKAAEKETRKQFNDLKERLSNAEMENNRLRGYVQRVQEDDVVREELVQTGDPEGEVRMVPKRRPTSFTEPAVVSDLRDRPSGAMGYVDESYRDRNYKPKHWITY